MMKQLLTRVKEEWQDFDISYPQWLTHIVLDELYYAVTLVVTCIACFEVGLVIGIVWTVV